MAFSGTIRGNPRDSNGAALGGEGIGKLNLTAIVLSNLPAVNCLLKLNFLADRGALVIEQALSGALCVSSADVGEVSGLTALLELACENRDGDSGQNGR